MTVSQQNSLTEERDKLKRINLRWMVFSGSLYTVSSIQKNWQESRDDCIQKGADLVTINSQEEQNFLNQFDKTMWLGLTDLETEGTWKWVDGTPMTERYWGPGEPNGRTSENCGHIKQFNVGKRWNDGNCNTKTFWTCEKKVSP
ncbi:C-type lectin domain family 4 member M-like [Pseudochaenichthys georgianus]|uniref:C-type lectin domain family 4 member M-like n=1 Tax=Pseudochaenichthys georgianus TaxID=52239 RepID=UPI0039C01D9A